MIVSLNASISASISAYDKLRQAILSLELSPGAVLTERQLEGFLETSRTTVRSALARLENEGLVARDGRGYMVTPIDLREIQHACEFREAIELAAVRATIERASNDAIQTVFLRLENTVPDTNLETYMSRATDFHVSLAQLSNNPFFVRALEDVLTRLARARWFEASTQPARERANAEHRRILECLQARDAAATEREIKAHLTRSKDRLLNALLGSNQLQIRASNRKP
jgi:DNA-binding GntR family transcriptional regulator